MAILAVSLWQPSFLDIVLYYVDIVVGHYVEDDTQRSSVRLAVVGCGFLLYPGCGFGHQLHVVVCHISYSFVLDGINACLLLKYIFNFGFPSLM